MSNERSGTSRVFALGRGAVTARNVAILVAVLAVAKVVVLTGTTVLVAHGNQSNLVYLFSPKGFTALLRSMSESWDSVQYQLIARSGYSTFKGSELYAFSPIYPSLVYAAHFLTGSYWTAALLVTNIIGFGVPVVFLRLFGLRAAILAETFPVYLVYSTVGYSDVLAILALAMLFLCYLDGRFVAAGIAAAIAGLVFYDLLVVPVVFVAHLILQRENRISLRRLLLSIASLVTPVVIAGLAILIAYWNATGDPFVFFELEHVYWGVAPTNPMGQIVWLFSGTGIGSFTGMMWYVYGVRLGSVYWAARNVLFEAFFFAGIYLIARLKFQPQRWLLVWYSLLVSVPLLLVEGTPVYSIPRLLLAAFPAFFGYASSIISGRWSLVAYVATSLLVGCWVLLTFTFAFFA